MENSGKVNGYPWEMGVEGVEHIQELLCLKRNVSRYFGSVI